MLHIELHAGVMLDHLDRVVDYRQGSKPQKSIFNSPSSSSVVIVNCVVIEPSDPRESGTK